MPAEPSGPVHGNPPFANAGETRALEEAVRRASTPEHPVVLVLHPAKGLDSPAERAARLEKAWPGRILLVAFRPDSAVFLAVPDALRGRFPEEQRRRILAEIDAATTNATWSRTLARAVGEIAILAEGRTPPPWVPWQHPLATLGGGQDEEPAPLALGIGIAVVALLLVLFLLYMLVTNPMAVVAFVVQGAVEGLIGGAFGGGGGGGGFSGGGAASEAAAPPGAGRRRTMLRRAHKRFLAGLDLAAVEAAIREAERSTTGEIRVAVLPRLRGGLEKAVRPAAERLGMTRTSGRNGVLILVEPSRRAFLVWGDIAIHANVGDAFWQEVATAIEDRFRAGDFTGGLVRGIEAAGRGLVAHFPRGPGTHPNELPDSVDVS